MKMNKFIPLLSIAILGFSCLTGCGNSDPVTPVVEKNVFTLNETSKELAYDESFKLNAFFASGNVEEIKWSSSNDSVVTVNENGLVTAKNIGTAMVFAESSSYSTSCTFTVTFGKYVPELIINNTYDNQIIIAKGQTFYVNANVYFNNKSYDTFIDAYDYDTNVISYDSGKITAKNVGNTEILFCGQWKNAATDLISKKITVKVVDNISFYCEVTVNGEKSITNSVILSSVDSWCGKTYNTSAIIEPVIYVNGQYHLANFEVQDNGVVSHVGNSIKAKKPGTNIIDLFFEDSSSGLTYSTSILATVNCPIETYNGETVTFSAEEKFPVEHYFGKDAKILSATQSGKELYVHDNFINGLDQLGAESSPIQIITDKGGYIFNDVFIYTSLVNKSNFLELFTLVNGNIKTGYYILDEDITEEIDFTSQKSSDLTTHFAGTFDGQGHTVNVLVGPNGIFGGLGDGTVIKNCKFNIRFKLESGKTSYSGIANNEKTFINNDWEVRFDNNYVSTTNFSEKCHALFEYRPNNLLMNNNYIEINGDKGLEKFTNVTQEYAALFKYDVTPLTGPSNQYYGDMRNNYVVTSKFMPLANADFQGMKGRYVSYAKNDDSYIKLNDELSMIHSVDKPEQSRYRIVYPGLSATKEQKQLYGLINVPELVTTGVIPSLDTPMAAFYSSSYSDGGIARYNSKAEMGITTIGSWEL